MAKIAKCEPAIEAIVGAVVARTNVSKRCPPWGGEKSLHVVHDHFIFPPVPNDVKAKILTHFGEDKHRVAFAEAIGDSPNIVCLETVYAISESDVVAPFYDAGVRQLLESDRRDLFIYNRAAFERLGYAIPENGPATRIAKTETER